VRLPNTVTIVLLAAAAFGFVAVWDRAVGLPGFAIAVVVLAALLLWNRFDSRGASRRWLTRASNRPIVLQPPFEGQWRVAAGGPDPRRNHHQSVSDQYFAYDFERVDGPSWDAPIVAPCGGMIVHVESRRKDVPPEQRRHDRARPFGNYVSIETSRGFVILAHLKQGSVTVRVGDTVRAGDAIGRCGNSGNTRGAHLHVHAQDLPSAAVATAQAVPIAFASRTGGEPMLLEYGDTLA
jgi:hypothetical protein